MARPSKFNEQIKAKMLELYEKGKTDQQVADIIGVSVRTIDNWKGKHPEFLQALKEMKQVADELVVASLFSRAVGYSHKEEQTFMYKGEVIVHENIKQYPPDVTAAIFWLKNRQPEFWKDKQTMEHEGGDPKKPITVQPFDLKERIEQLESGDGE